MTDRRLLKPFPFVFHCSMWSLYFAWIAWGNVVRYGVEHLIPIGVIMPLMLGLAYLHRYWLRNLIVSQKDWKKILLRVVAMVIAIGGLGYALLYKYTVGVSASLLPNPDHHRLGDYVLDYLDFYWRFAGIGLGIAAAEVLVNLFRERLYMLRQKRRAVSAQQKHLNMQRWLSHFMGNVSHHTVYGLGKGLQPQQVKASLAINGYGVRLLAQKTFWVSLKDELYYLNQLAQMFATAPIQLDIPAKTYTHQVVPLTLLALYKNMCKHGAFGAGMTKACFRVITTQNKLLVLTQNTISSDARWIYKEGGTGLEQLKGLLWDSYGEKALLHYDVQEELFALRLEIVYDKDE